VKNAIYIAILILFLFGLVVLLGLVEYNLIYRRNWKLTPMLLLFVPTGILTGVFLAWLGGLRTWDLLVGVLVGGVLMFINIWRQVTDSKSLK
jgi:hypothetical protein